MSAGLEGTGLLARGARPVDRRRMAFAWRSWLERVRPVLRREAPGFAVAAAALGLVFAFAGPVEGPWPTGRDAFCYWIPSLASPYARPDWTAQIAYVYSPAFLQALAPLKALSWQAFLAVWTAILLLAIRYLSGPRLYAAAIAFAAFELAGGNVHLLLAAAIVLGFRRPAAWALVLLTKVTPGIGLLWFAVRGEWRNLGIALGATAAIAGASLLVAPSAWLDWIGILAASTTKTEGTWAAIAIPLWARLPVAVAVVTWGARTDRRWTVPVAAMIALPAMWFGGLSMLLAVIPLRGREAARPAGPSAADAPRRDRRPAAPAAPPVPTPAPASGGACPAA